MSSFSHDTSVLIRIDLADASTECFVRQDLSDAQTIVQSINPALLFAQPRLVIASIHSKSVFVPSEINRVDFVRQDYISCKFPEGYFDIVELCEVDLRNRAHLEEPDKMPRRAQSTPIGDLIVSFLKLRFKGGLQVFLMTECSARLPVENQSFIHLWLSRNPFPMRLHSGGFAFLNLANLSSYTVYPGTSQIPSDSWITEPTTCRNFDCLIPLQAVNE